MKLFNCLCLAIGAIGFFGMVTAGYLNSLTMLIVSASIVLFIYWIWEISVALDHRKLLRQIAMDQERWKNSKPQCLGGKGVNIFR